MRNVVQPVCEEGVLSSPAVIDELIRHRDAAWSHLRMYPPHRIHADYGPYSDIVQRPEVRPIVDAMR